MKSADIQVGAEYAIGSHNATYDKWRRARARVVAVKQTGITQGDWRTYSCSEKRFVEIEIVEDEQSHTNGLYRWHFTVDAKSGNFSEYEKHELRKVRRVPSNMVLMLWDDYAEKLDAHVAAEAERDARLERERDERNDVIFRLSELGFDHVYTHGTGFHFNLDDTVRVCELVTALKGAVGENAFDALFKERQTNG